MVVGLFSDRTSRFLHNIGGVGGFTRVLSLDGM